MRARLLLATLLPTAGCNLDLFAVTPPTGAIIGTVVDLDGDPLGGATVSLLEDGHWEPETSTDAQGQFATGRVKSNRWLKVEADGYLPRVRPGGPTELAIFRLSESDGSTVRLVFAGSTTFGEGFYDADRVGAIRPGLEPMDVPAALAGVLPLMDGAQLANLALEGPLSAHAAEHPEKPDVYRNQPLLAPALASAGFHFAHLANDHAYDLLEPGLAETLFHLDSAGLSHQGAGRDEDEAWAPALRDVGAVRLAMLGCTTVTGLDYAVHLAADDEQAKGGAAACERERLEAALASAAGQADFVVLQLHGGQSLDPTPSETMAELSELALASGADLVINHHPRVNGGVAGERGALVLESLGALATDLTLWQSFPSALLEIHVDADGVLQRAILEPVLRDGLRPMAVVGWPRQRIARDIAARSGALVALDGGALEIDLGDRSKVEERRTELAVDLGSWSHPIDLRDGWLTEVTGAQDWRVGRDLLRVGDFEDIDVDDQLAEGMLWTLDSPYEWLSDQAALSGAYGLRLLRDASHTEAVWTHPAHRIPVEEGQALTLCGQLDTEGSVEIQLSWYQSSSGESFERSYHLLEATEGWAPFALELEPPAGAEAVNVYIKLHPSERGRVTADLDELRLVAWESGQPGELQPYDMLRVQGSAAYTLRRRVMPIRSP
jgi:poly-gamma-glutamate capsule biosynthesis protein CapA/YwtB (metallophosphatase superfamily)